MRIHKYLKRKIEIDDLLVLMRILYADKNITDKFITITLCARMTFVKWFSASKFVFE